MPSWQKGNGVAGRRKEGGTELGNGGGRSP